MEEFFEDHIFYMVKWQGHNVMTDTPLVNLPLFVSENSAAHGTNMHVDL